MSHTCKALVVHCIDFRLQKAIKKYLEEHGLLGNCDIVSVAGGVKNHDFVMSQIEVSQRLHNISQVILMNHTDCGAYGGKVAFVSDEEENRTHEADLKKAKDAVLTKYPGLKIKAVIGRILPESQVKFEEIK